jgi:lipopolysaccharide export system permease protein
MGEYWGQNGIRRKVVQSVEQVAYGKLRTSRSYSTPRFSLSVKRLEGNRLIQPTLFYQPADETEAVSITAAEGQLRSNLDEMTLSVVCYNGSASVGDKVKMVFPDTMEQVIPLESVTTEKVTWRDVNRSLRMIRGELTKEKKHAAELERYCLAQSAAGQNAPSVAIGREELAESRLRICWLETLSYRRWANGFFCLAYVMLGVPVAMLLRSGDHLSNFFACFLPILLVNYPMHAIFIQLAQAGDAPSWTPWAGNVLLMICGVWLLRKAV